MSKLLIKIKLWLMCWALSKTYGIKLTVVGTEKNASLKLDGDSAKVKAFIARLENNLVDAGAYANSGKVNIKGGK